jgi:type II secretory pathway pseudopilin PulG
MVVVLAIVGMLAAMVTLSLVGLTGIAQQRAQDAERMQVQAALDAMMMDQGIDPGGACPPGTPAAGPTDNMTGFPSANRYAGPNSHQPVALAPHYLRGSPTKRKYWCAANGEIRPAHP